VFVGVGLGTRWPAAAFLAAAGAWALSAWWRPDRAARTGTDRLEAIAVWTELLRDTLSAAAGLEQAILSTATTAPSALAMPVADLAARLQDGGALPVALRAFANDVDDPTMDLVVAALVLAATRQARDLTGLLSTLAQAARDQVVLRLRVGAGRARVRTSVRIIMATTLGMIAALVLLNRGYLTVYDSAEGQLVLLAVGGLFALAFAWLDRIAAVPVPPRILAPPARTASAPPATTAPSRAPR
jgi:tight adherence protein B